MRISSSEMQTVLMVVVVAVVQADTERVAVIVVE